MKNSRSKLFFRNILSQREKKMAKTRKIKEAEAMLEAQLDIPTFANNEYIRRTNRIKRRKVNAKRIVSALTVIMILMTPLFNHMANQARGQKGIGGECFAFLIPFIFYEFVKSAAMLHDAIKENI